jgi:hypothetical protein
VKNEGGAIGGSRRFSFRLSVFEASSSCEALVDRPVDASFAPMLEMRPNCDCCDKDLDPSGTETRICSFECTYCSTCADTTLKGKCPNCGGPLVERPARMAQALAKFPASTRRVVKTGGCPA